jgi:phospholipid/cholesterol/gamma-HCH transport system ATP-binding protein
MLAPPAPRSAHSADTDHVPGKGITSPGPQGKKGQKGLGIAVRGLCKRFGPKVVFDGLDLEVRPGETLTVLGPSGSGKSVLLRVLVGLQKPDAGQVLVGGTDLAPLDERSLRPLRRRIGMLFQGAALFDSMSVGENVAYGLRERDDTDAETVRTRVAECLEWVGLPGTEHMNPAALSGGMKKRIGLARALAPGPSIILYDEPTTGLDPANCRRINELIRSLQERLGVTSLVITHDVTSAFEVSDRIALLWDHRADLVVDAAEARRAPPPRLEKFLHGESLGSSKGSGQGAGQGSGQGAGMGAST